MSSVYIDSSSMVAIAFNEPGAAEVRDNLNGFTRRVSSNLLEAELRSAHTRAHRQVPAGLLSSIDWILPTRSLAPEFEAVLSAGYLRGADLWHVACALYVSPDPGQLTFVTLDQRQRAVAATLGFVT